MQHKAHYQWLHERPGCNLSIHKQAFGHNTAMSVLDNNTRNFLSALDRYIRRVCCVVFLSFGIVFIFAGFDAAANKFCVPHHNSTHSIDDKYYVLGLHGSIVIWNQTTGCIFVGGAVIVYIICEGIGALERCLHTARFESTSRLFYPFL